MRLRKRMLNDLDQDIRDHLERETQDNIERGMAPEEAHYAALRKFGNATLIREQTHAIWSLNRRILSTRSALCLSAIAEIARLFGNSGAHTCAGDWRQCGDLQRSERSSASPCGSG